MIELSSVTNIKEAMVSMRKKPDEIEIVLAFFIVCGIIALFIKKYGGEACFEWVLGHFVLLAIIGTACFIICFKVAMPKAVRILFLVGSSVYLIIAFIGIMNYYSEANGNTASYEKREREREEEKRKVEEELRRGRAKNAAQNYSNYSQEFNNAVRRGDRNTALSAANRRDKAYSEWMKNQ